MLRLVEKNPDRVEVTEVATPSARRQPPPSPGTLPLHLARHLRAREVLVWWGTKHDIRWRRVLGIAGLCAGILVIVTAFYPGFWLQGWSSMWPPLSVLFAPAGLVLLRELASQRAILVTDNSVIDAPRRGRADRLGFDAVRRVRRDLWTGGVRLDGAQHVVRIPQDLESDARQAIASQRVGMVRASEASPEDDLGWMP